ncbi:Hypothetical protein A7982_07560 [Minicystis rosea]|nr:Hypothetical protein A7982_07560 [Minicystis rosea]
METPVRESVARVGSYPGTHRTRDSFRIMGLASRHRRARRAR